MRLLPVEPVELLFDFGARKLVAESPPEARDALPELWDWLDAAGLDPHPVDSRGLELAGFGELMREEGGKPLAELPARVLRADLRTDFGYSGGAIPELSVSARIGAAAEVSAFNDVTDDDPDGLLAAEAEEGLEELLPPQLLLDDAHAWLKYTLSAELGTSGGATLDDLGVRIDAGKKLRLNDYRRHARDNIAVGTILSDLCRPRVALTTDHVLALRSGDCLAMQFVGTMAASVEITWADIFAGQFGNLGALLGGKQVIPLRLSTGLTVSASVSIEDDFVLAFSRLDRDRLRVALRKAKQRRAGLALAAGAQVELSDPAQIEPALHAVVEGVVGEPYAELRAVLGGAIDRLDARETKLVLALLKALGMDPAVPDGVAELRGLLQEISQRLDELETQIDRTIRTAARAKIAAGFRYEYDRISTRSSLLQATLTHDALRAHHAELIRGHADGLLEAIRAQQAGVELESYLQRRRLDTRKSWGFTLGFGAWSVYGRDRDRVTRVLDRNEQDRQRVAYTGLRAYAGNWFGESFEWSLDFRADMGRFAAGDTPRMSEFHLGLALTWTRHERLTEKAISKLLDAAALWGVCSTADYTGLAEGLRPDLDADCEITVQLRVEDATLRAVLPRLGAATLADFAAAYGAAMPWMAEFPGRRDLDVRRELYAPLWRAYFHDTDQRPDQLAARAVRHFELMPMPHKELRVVEDTWQTRPWATFAGLAQLNSKMIADLSGFNVGMAALAAAVAADRPSSGVLDGVFGNIKDIGKQSHNVRALGAYLLEAVAQTGGDARVEHSVQVAAPDRTHVLVRTP
jgi:hypothetical protein